MEIGNGESAVLLSAIARDPAEILHFLDLLALFAPPPHPETATYLVGAYG